MERERGGAGQGANRVLAPIQHPSDRHSDGNSALGQLGRGGQSAPRRQSSRRRKDGRLRRLRPALCRRSGRRAGFVRNLERAEYRAVLRRHAPAVCRNAEDRLPRDQGCPPRCDGRRFLLRRIRGIRQALPRRRDESRSARAIRRHLLAPLPPGAAGAGGDRSARRAGRHQHRHRPVRPRAAAVGHRGRLVRAAQILPAVHTV
ncbi:MAG: hypothetical protein BWZ10_03117 [candidate division BRC1 bacterium ADurb.BinA364]|nr:MAG: hypothetical protein BWZ10_03117 [candidate division BRC1 bacterium ADurb.BinA364]